MQLINKYLLNKNIEFRLLTSPRGRKSSPTMDSRTDDFPADCEPSTHILGNLINC